MNHDYRPFFCMAVVLTIAACGPSNEVASTSQPRSMTIASTGSLGGTTPSSAPTPTDPDDRLRETFLSTSRVRDLGVIDTPMGSFDWWHLSGVEGELPGMSWVVAVDSGYLMIDDLPHLESGGTRYWRSPDGKRWFPAESPGIDGSVSAYQLIGGQHWVITEGRAVWRSGDGEAWVEVDPPAGFNDVPGNAVQLHEVDGQTLLVGVDSPGMWLFSATNTAWERISPPVVPNQGGPPSWLSFGTPATVGETTVILSTLDPILDPREGIQTGTLQISLTVIGPGGQVTSVPPPWDPLVASPATRTSANQSRGVTVVSARDRFLAFVVDKGIELWTSPDGIDWTGPIRPEFVPEEGDGYYGNFQSEGEVVIAEIFDRSGMAMVWISEDGNDWFDSGIPPQSGLESSTENDPGLIQLGSGGIYLGSEPAQEIFVSADLRNWERVDAREPAIWEASSWVLGRSKISTAGETVFFMSFSMHTGETDIWGLRRQR